MSNGFYKAYLMSDHWQEFRKYVLETRGRKCEDCGVTEGVVFDVHHLSYENLGDEQLEDVVVLCHSCHMARHPEKFHRGCKHEHLNTAVGYGSYELSFLWQCNSCKQLIGMRNPTEKEIAENQKYMDRQRKWHEKQAAKEAEREVKRQERLVAKRERDKIKPKKHKKRKPYKKRTKTVRLR